MQAVFVHFFVPRTRFVTILYSFVSEAQNGYVLKGCILGGLCSTKLTSKHYIL